MAPAVDTLRDESEPCWGMEAERVAAFPGQRGQPGVLGPEDQGHRLVAEVQLVQRLASLAHQPDRPHTQGREADEGGGHPGHQGHGKVLDGTGGGLGGRGREVGRAVTGEHHTGHPGTLRTA